MASKKRKKRRPRARQPVTAPAAPAEPTPAKRHRGMLAAADERPPAPWGTFPLVEIAIFVGIVILFWGLIGGGDRAPLLIGIGLGLAGLGGVELAIREHFAGFRSHSTLLGGIPAVAVLALLFYAGPDSLSPLARVGISVAVFAASVYGLATMFRRKAGVAIKLR
jgi:hypothetical protein